MEQTEHIDPQFLWLLQPFFLILLGCSTRGHWEPQALYLELVLTASNSNSNSNCNWLQLTQTVCGTGLYNCLTFTCFLWASQLHRIQPVHRSRWHLRHPRPDAPVFWLTARSKVNMLQYLQPGIRHQEWDAQTSLGFWDKNESRPDLVIVNKRERERERERENQPSSRLCRPSRQQSKI